MHRSAKPNARLTLEEFFPFRLNRLADAVSVNLSAIYRDRFRLEISEWRVLVTVGHAGECTAQYIAASTRMHKTRVSRAVASLVDRALLSRSANGEDGREMPLALTSKGLGVYTALVPLALARESELLACLSEDRRRALLEALTSLEDFLKLSS